MSAHELVVKTIEQEHRVLGHVVEVLQHVLRDIAAEHAEADFNLLAAALYYIDDFPERLHHPKEDEHLFAALRARSPEFNAVLDELQGEHVLGAEMVREMHAALVHYLAGAYGSLEAFKLRVDAYASMLREHMRKEESLLARACTSLTESEWRDILAAFEANQDPLLARDVRAEFRKLYRRIQNLLPHKLRYPARTNFLQ
jgi:hemerythrin-like domain-containing protein